MNIFEIYKSSFNKIIFDNFKEVDKNITFSVDVPKNKNFGDIAYNAPLVLSSILKENPIDIANKIKKEFDKIFSEFESVEVAKPGFLNIKFKNFFLVTSLSKIQKNFGFNNHDNQRKINIEFVSANPTGPLHVGHCRGAIFGDVLGNLLSATGNEVTKEYYINDYGNQIILFIKSVYFRILEIKKIKKFPDNEGLYPGEYIIDIANEVLKDLANINLDNFEDSYSSLEKLSIDVAMKIIKSDLQSMGIQHDIFVSEQDIVKKKLLDKAIQILKKNNNIYHGTLPKPKGDVEDWEPREQLLFKSTNFGDDSDRALQKSDGSWTYFANDIAYHYDKLNRNYDEYINILGADHAGYIKRIKSATSAMNPKKKFTIKVSQIVKLFKSGKPFRMSKRAGDFILAKDLIETVGKDAARFMMIFRSSQSPLDFDIDVVTDKSKENPIFYVQYASARLNSLFNKSKLNIEDDLSAPKSLKLNHESEINLIKKILEWPKIINLSLQHLEVHFIPYYLYELVSEFHSYWNLGKMNDEMKILENEDHEIKISRLFLLQKLYFVIKNGLFILGIKPIKEM